MKDYLIQIKIKNAPMMNMMRANGIETAAELHRASGVCQTAIGNYLNLKEIPINENSGRWKPSILKIAAALKVLPEMLFPERHITKALKTNKVEGQVSFEDIGNLIDSSEISVDRLSESITDGAHEDVLDMLEECLGTLTVREQKVLKKRFGIKSIFRNRASEDKPGKGSHGGMTYEEVGEDFSISIIPGNRIKLTAERVRQIEARALRKMRHSSRMGKAPQFRVKTQSEREKRESAHKKMPTIFSVKFEKEHAEDQEREKEIERARIHGGRCHHLIEKES